MSWAGRSWPALSRRTQIVLFVGLVLAFVLVRWVGRREPWNSDDMILFGSSVEAAAGHHWVFGSAEAVAEFAGFRIPHAAHTALRVGLLPLGIPAVRLLGASASAYYLVPLSFSLLGFSVLYWVVLRNFGSLVALVFAAIHVAWPFELEHASLFLTDVPAAATSLLSLCLLDESARRTRWARAGCVVLAGLAAWETYLLRNNGLVLLAPAVLVLLWSRSTRRQTIAAIAVAALGVLGQQALLVYRGLGLGYDWSSVRKDFAEYAPFLPVYSWGSFLVRQFVYQLTTFGKGLTGILAVLLVLGSLVLHVLLLRLERRRVLLLAIAAFGLFSWLVFSFSIYERVPGGVRATVPVNFRFVQPFTYSSLVVWAWAWCSLRESWTAAGWRSLGLGATPGSGRFRLLASVALPSVLLTFSLLAWWVRRSETYLHSGTRRVVQEIQRRAAHEPGALSIAGTEASLNVPRLFCRSSRNVHWAGLSPGELAELVERGDRALVLRDVPRELTLVRYYAPEAQPAYRAELARIETSLWKSYEFSYIDGQYALFAPAQSPVPGADQARTDWTLPAASIPGAAPLTGTACRTLPGEDGTSRTLVPTRSGASRALCQYAWPADERVSAVPAEPRAESNGFVVRLHAEYELPLSLSVEVVQYVDGDAQRSRTRLLPGTSYVPVRLAAGARAVSLVYQVVAGGAPEGQYIRLDPAEWRPHRFVAGAARSVLEPAGGAAAP